MKRRILGFIMVLCMSVTIAFGNVSAIGYGDEWEGYESSSSRKYSDVPKNHWAYENIQRVTEKNWFGGYPDGTFRPSASITRAEALKVFVVFLGLELEDVTRSSYYDVKVTDWYSPYIEAGKDLLPERTSIQGKVPFQPDMPITREDAIYALVTALGYDSEVEFADQSVLNMFSDKNSISRNIKPYVAVAVNEGLVSGHADGTIGGQDPLTRAEFATLLYRATYVGFNSEPEAKLQSVSISPSTRKTLKVGESFTISATATYSDGSTKSYTSINPYNADDNGIVSINRNTVTAVKSGNCEINFNDDNLKYTSIIVIVEEEEKPKCTVCGSEDCDASEHCAVCGATEHTTEKHSKTDFSDDWYKKTDDEVLLPIDGGYINGSGEWMIEPQFSMVLPFAKNGLACVEKNGKWGYIDTSGEWVIEPKFDKGYDHCATFSENGLAAVMVDEKMGFINEDGDIVIEPQFMVVTDFGKNEFAGFLWGGGYEHGFVNEDGEIIFGSKEGGSVLYGVSDNGLAAAEVNGKYGYIDETGEWVIEPQFDYADNFGANDLAMVEKNGRYGFINKKGKWIFDHKYGVYTSLFAENGLAAACDGSPHDGDKYGFIDETGDMVIEAIYDRVTSFSSNGLAGVCLNGKWGYIDEYGKWAIKPQFSEAEAFDENGYAKVNYNGIECYVTTEGKIIMPR